MGVVKKIQFGIFFLLVLLSVQSTLATSISPGKATIDFEPNLEKTLSFYLCGAESIQSYIKDFDLGQYATIEDNNQNGGCRHITVHIKFPENISPPGKHRILVGGLQLEGSAAGITTRVAIQATVYVNVPYEGMYPVWRFDAPNANEGEPVLFQAIVTNLGLMPVPGAYVSVDVSSNNSLLKNLKSATKVIPALGEEIFLMEMSTVGMKSGTYDVLAKLHYDAEEQPITTQFNIGTLYVAINSFSEMAEQGRINPINVEIESKWNNLLEDVYANIQIGNSKLKTASIDLKPWEKTNITGYYDAGNIPLGFQDVSIVLHYEDAATTKSGKLEIIKPTSEEKPSSFNFKITPVHILIGIILLLVILDIMWFATRKRK
ncbi:MAG: hypothetical protein ABIG95_04505 [Candidatus Woesearchaeota archaeon]